MKFISVVGARPQFVKVAPVHVAMSGRHEHIIVHTGQHYDYRMSQVFFEVLNIPEPKYDLGVGSGTHGEQTAKMLALIEDVLIKERPDCVIVYGDTNSTLAGALAAVKLNVPVAHVEAGLRSYRHAMPEEINRVLTDHISKVLLCPTSVASSNLAKEGIVKGVHVVGDTMVQSLIEITPRLDPSVLFRYGVKEKGYVLATIHRQENADSRENMSEIVEAMLDHAGDIVLPLHPRTAKNLTAWGMMDRLKGAGNVKVVEPMDYVTFTTMERFASHIMTDSGGVQKEAYFFKVPCTTVRDETEWVETLEGGWNVLAGASRKRIAVSMARPVPMSPQTSYGDASVSSRIVDVLEGELE
ncbi:MAG: UDP-N-acetylglucosamine 2-epimerase (non-hydrolyzing) [Euryarchaeota archaeon]|nr:UDP-N-acetylglucosamine 2-epimerase (non-hydrolyzing) [Euryarchaeota archaeon]